MPNRKKLLLKQAKLNKLELYPAEERVDFEKQQHKKRIDFERKIAEIKREQEYFECNRRLKEEKLLREQEDFERNKRFPKELKQKREEFERERQLQEAFELERLDLQLSREQRERRFQHLLFESKLRADLEEANAEIAACDDVVHTTDKINKFKSASKTVRTLERNINGTLDCAKAPIVTVADSIANTSQSVASNLCVGSDYVAVQTSSE